MLPVTAKPTPAPTYSPARIDAVDPAALPAAEPVADERGDHRAGRGRDGAEEQPRPQQLAEVRGGGAPEHRGAPGDDGRRPGSGFAVTRSARTPNGSEANAPTRELTATSRPMSVFVMCRPDRSSLADAPTVAASAPLSPRIAASTMITRVRSSPPSATVRRRAAPLAAAEPMAAASVSTRWVRDSSLLTPSWSQARPPVRDQTSRRTRRTAAIRIAAAQ